MRINLPNQITIARLIMAIIFFVLLAQFDIHAAPPAYWLVDVCAWLFVVAAMSDAVDGYLARRYNQITSFGRVIDPFVDKVLVCGAFVFFASSSFVTDGKNVTYVSTWMAVVILGRELLVTGLRGFTEAQGTAFGANVTGKLKMVLQSFTAGWILFTVAHADGVLSWKGFAIIRFGLVWATVIVTLLSMLSYLYAARNILKQTSALPPAPEADAA